VKDIFSTINLRISTYLFLYNNFTLSHIHKSLYLIYRTLRAHNFNRFQKKEVTIRRYSKNIICSFRRMFIAASRWRLFLKIYKRVKSCKTIWINQRTSDELKQIHLSMNWKRILTHRKCWCLIWTNDSSKRNVCYAIAKSFRSLKKWKRKFVLWSEKRVKLSKNQRKRSSQKKSNFFRIIWCNQSLFQRKSLHRLFLIREKTWQRRVNERSDSTRFLYITINQSRNIEIMSKIWWRLFVWFSTTFRRRTRRLYTLCNL
jgi:hypothetical protein